MPQVVYVWIYPTLLLDRTLPPAHPGIPHESPYRAPDPRPHNALTPPVVGRLGNVHDVNVIARVFSVGYHNGV